MIQRATKPQQDQVSIPGGRTSRGWSSREVTEYEVSKPPPNPGKPSINARSAAVTGFS